jgi:hypothetical protein
MKESPQRTRLRTSRRIAVDLPALVCTAGLAVAMTVTTFFTVVSAEPLADVVVVDFASVDED